MFFWNFYSLKHPSTLIIRNVFYRQNKDSDWLFVWAVPEEQSRSPSDWDVPWCSHKSCLKQAWGPPLKKKKKTGNSSRVLRILACKSSHKLLLCDTNPFLGWFSMSMCQWMLSALSGAASPIYYLAVCQAAEKNGTQEISIHQEALSNLYVQITDRLRNEQLWTQNCR